MNRFSPRVSFDRGTVVEHDRLGFAWSDCLGPVVGLPDAGRLFTLFEIMDHAADRIELARRVFFMQSFGVEQREIDRLVFGRALDVCARVLAMEEPDRVLSVVSWALTVERLTSIACKLRDHLNSTTPKDATP